MTSSPESVAGWVCCQEAVTAPLRPTAGAAQPQLAHRADHGDRARCARATWPSASVTVQAHRVDAVRDDARPGPPRPSVRSGRPPGAARSATSVVDGRPVGGEHVERDGRRRRERVVDRERVVGAVAVGRDHRGRERERRRRRRRRAVAPERCEQRPRARAGGVARLDAVRELASRARAACRRSASPFQLQATSSPLPLLLATGAPCASSTVTRPARAAEHARAEGDRHERAARRRRRAPGGVAARRRSWAFRWPAPRRRSRRAPDRSARPGSRSRVASRWPLTTRKLTLLPAAIAVVAARDHASRGRADRRARRRAATRSGFVEGVAGRRP